MIAKSQESTAILVSGVFSAVVALLTAYSIAVGLERLIRTMAKLHYSWAHIAADYERLWNHSCEDAAEAQFDEIRKRERELSELAAAKRRTNRNSSRSGTPTYCNSIVFGTHER